MIKARGFFTQLSFDPQRFTQTLNANLEIQLRQAAREWLGAVILKVPTWTGMSLGSFRPLGAFLKYKIPINPVKTRKGMGPDVGEFYQDFSFSIEGTQFIFEFDEKVPHYVINEFYNVRPPINLKRPGPYNSFEAGKEAFERYVADVLPERLPKLEDLIVQTRIDIAGN